MSANCLKDDCNRSIYAKGKCRYHYWSDYRYSKVKTKNGKKTIVKKSNRIHSVSKNNRYKTSTGETVSQSTFNRRVSLAKEEKIDQQRLDFGFNFCEDCKVNGSNTFLDCSHDIGIKKGSIENAWDTNNITIRCRDCHDKYGDGKIINNEQQNIRKSN